jgi:hypothetical protein
MLRGRWGRGLLMIWLPTKLFLYLHLCFSCPRSGAPVSANQHARGRKRLAPCAQMVLIGRRLWVAHNWTYDKASSVGPGHWGFDGDVFSSSRNHRDPRKTFSFVVLILVHQPCEMWACCHQVGRVELLLTMHSICTKLQMLFNDDGDAKPEDAGIALWKAEAVADWAVPQW